MTRPGADQREHSPSEVDSLHAAGDRIEALLEASSANGTAARTRAEDLVACVSGLYGAGLQRVLEILDGMGRLDTAVFDALADDELVSGLLLVHDLHPYDVRTRVQRALESVRPYLGSHGGDVELLGVDDEGVVSLRLLGSCDGCPSSSVTLQLAVEGAVQAAAPETTRIDVQTSDPAGPKAGAVISLDSLRSRIGTAEVGPGWVDLPELLDLGSGELAGFEVEGLSVCACRIGSDLYCFRDRCGHCGESLGGSALERRLGDPVGTGVLRCRNCRAHFDVRHAGAGLDDAEEHLEPLPVVVRNGVASIAVPSAAT